MYMAGLPTPPAQALLKKLVQRSTLQVKIATKAQVDLGQREERIEELPNMSKNGMNAELFASRLSQDARAASEQQTELECKRRKLLGLGQDLQPRKAIEALSRAQERAPMNELLDRLVKEAKIEANRKSLKSVAAGLRAWHLFGLVVLLYPLQATLPPRCSMDAQRFVMVFSNAGTAANYISNILWACKVAQLDTTWRDFQVSMVLKGFDKKLLRCRGTSLVIKFLLDDIKIRTLVRFADSFSPELAEAVVVRVPAESSG